MYASKFDERNTKKYAVQLNWLLHEVFSIKSYMAKYILLPCDTIE